MSDLRDIAVKYAHLLSAPDYSKLLNLADEIERLQAIVDAAKHLLAGGDKEAVYHLEQALDALEDE